MTLPKRKSVLAVDSLVQSDLETPDGPGMCLVVSGDVRGAGGCSKWEVNPTMPEEPKDDEEEGEEQPGEEEEPMAKGKEQSEPVPKFKKSEKPKPKTTPEEQKKIRV